MSAPPILDQKDPKAASVFAPAALLREARRQKGLAFASVPPVCILDPDGDILRRLKNAGLANPFAAWPCYHTELYTFPLAGETVGILGCVVGAPFAVLIAEELFASGCRFVVSLTSAGQIVPAGSVSVGRTPIPGRSVHADRSAETTSRCVTLSAAEACPHPQPAGV